MKILVTGGAGFIGLHLCDRLLADGNDVIAFDILPTGAGGNRQTASVATWDRHVGAMFAFPQRSQKLQEMSTLAR